MRQTKVCVTVAARTTAELRQRRDAITDADLVELRLDTVADPSVAAALADRACPVIVTCRPAWEGGHFQGSEEERRRLLAEAQHLGAEYVDVEWRAGFTDIIDHRDGAGVIVSMHDFDGVPRDLAARAGAMRATGAEVIKLAVMTSRLTDLLPLMRIGRAQQLPAVLIGMGDAGVASRILAARFGSAWTYAGSGIAPGQLPAARLIREFSVGSITPQAAVYGVVGRPVMHSLSPAMHNAAFRAAGMDAVYVPLAAADFDDFVAFAEAVPVAGVSVTAPYKLAAFERAAETDPVSRRIRAVNTLRRDDHRWLGCNTDLDGFLAPLHSRLTLKQARATVLGAGGAARAVAEALRSAGAQVSVAARRRDQAAHVAALTGGTTASWPPAPGSWDLLVNATPLGTVPETAQSPLPGGPFTGQLVYDLVYNPPDTTLLREARANGCQTLGGLDMLVAQAQRQFAWWTGVMPSDRVMRDAALKALADGPDLADDAPAPARSAAPGIAT